ncbi:MAG: hypothetical protein L0229_14995 [Blastocatellia bacterium]|nr:hypothetical protein [Blastocatellia bacterium]
MSDLINKLKSYRRHIVIIASTVALVIIAAIIFYIVQLNRRIESERIAQAEAARVEVREERLRAPSTDGFSLYLNSSDVRATANLAGTDYLATSGGLVALDDGGNVRRRYTTLDGLTDNDLTSLATFRDRLFIGTASAGLISFDGESFTGYTFVKPKATRVSALARTESELLIGTLDGGLFEYDGERFSRRFNRATGADFTRVTALLSIDARLYIGTQDAGLYIWREARIERIGTQEGLPSPHVTGLAPLPDGFKDKGRIAVATDFGVVALNDEPGTPASAEFQIASLSAQPNVTSLAVSGERLWAGLFTGGLIDLASDRANRDEPSDKNNSALAETAGLPRSAPAIAYTADGVLWALTGEGAFTREESSAGPAFEAVATSLARERVLTGKHITGLAFDGAGRLWVGYFDAGLDVIAPQTNERLSHVEDDRVREVNFVAFDRSEDRLLVATSRGLVVFDAGLKQSVLTRERNGLINDSIAHVSLVDNAPEGHALVLATAGGLTSVAGGRARSLTAFHGLASNHLYTSASAGSRLFVGSLAGLVELEGLRVVRVYKTSNSPLSHDWVTALAEAEGTLYVGTNGGGVDELLPTGEWVNFADQVGRFEVSQNAMHTDGERVYAGTGDRGLLVYNTRARRWTRISAGLPSQSVTAIVTDDEYIYLGTLNGLMRIEKRILE